MKTFLAVPFSILALLYALCVFNAYAETKVPDLSKLPGVAKTLQITGQVTSVNATANEITVVKKMREKKVMVTVGVQQDTAISKDKQKKVLADIKTGDSVVVTYLSKEGKNIAKSISIKPPIKKPSAEIGKEDGEYKKRKQGVGSEK
jgi:hypothetical protein